MKTLIKHTIPVLVILIWIALAVIISMASCSKDSPASVTSQAGQSQQLPKLVFSGQKITISLFAYSSLDPSTIYDFSINRKLVESFRVNQNENMKWDFEDFGAGTHRLNIYTRISNSASPSFSNFQFSISDGNVVQSVHATRIDQFNYGFDLVIE